VPIINVLLQLNRNLLATGVRICIHVLVSLRQHLDLEILEQDRHVEADVIWRAMTPSLRPSGLPSGMSVMSSPRTEGLRNEGERVPP